MAESLFDATKPSITENVIDTSLASIRTNEDAAQRLGFGMFSTTISSNAITLATGRPLDIIITGGGTLNTINNQSNVKNGDKVCLVAEGTDVTIGTSGNISTRLGLIKAGSAVWLRWSATNSKWEQIHAPTALPGCYLYKSGTQSIATATLTAITFDTESDVGGCHEGVTNPSRITVPAGHGGMWVFSGVLGYAANATGIRGALLRKNGATVMSVYGPNLGSGNGAAVPFSCVHIVVAGDYFEIVAYQDSGGNLNVLSADSTIFSAARVS